MQHEGTKMCTVTFGGKHVAIIAALNYRINCLTLMKMPQERGTGGLTMENEKLDVVSDAVVCGESVKIKTHFAKIIVEGTAKKPYYDILYFDPKDRTYHIGFGSFCLEYVFKWLSEEFEIVEATPVDAVEVVRCRDCKHSECYDTLLYCGHTRGLAGSVAPNNFCSYGKRKDGDKL